MIFAIQNRRRKKAGNGTPDSIPIQNLVFYQRYNGDLVDQTGNHSPTGSGISFSSGLYTGNMSESVEITNVDYINIPHSEDFNFGNGLTDTPFSLSFSVKHTMNQGTRMYACKRSVALNQFAVDREWNSNNVLGKIRFALIDESSNGALSVEGNTVMSLGVVYHVVQTYDGSGLWTGIKQYINAIKETNTNMSSGTYTAMENLGAPVTIGNLRAGGSGSRQPVNGRLDGYGLWDKALTQQEVLAIYTKQSSGQELI